MLGSRQEDEELLTHGELGDGWALGRAGASS